MPCPPYCTRRSVSRLSPSGRRWPCSVRTVVGGVVELRELAAFVAVVEEGGLRRRPPLPGAGQLMASNRVPRASPETRGTRRACLAASPSAFQKRRLPLRSYWSSQPPLGAAGFACPPRFSRTIAGPPPPDHPPRHPPPSRPAP